MTQHTPSNDPARAKATASSEAVSAENGLPLSWAEWWAALMRPVKDWLQEEGPWWLCSFVFHLVLVCSLALIGTQLVIHEIADSDAPAFQEADNAEAQQAAPPIDRFVVGETPEDPSELTTESLTLPEPGPLAQEEVFYSNDLEFSEKGGGTAVASNQPNLGGLGGFDLRSMGAGPVIKGKGGVGVGVGEGIHAGVGSDGMGFAGRGTGNRKALLGSGGGTRASERAVAAALNWLARHQSADGGWSLEGYKARCKDGTCTSPGATKSDIAGTAFGLLPFLAAGQTHESKGPYKKVISDGVAYLISHQKSEGNFVGGQTMYDHGLASIALCECYGMTGDMRVFKAAQAAVNFIAEAQDPAGGGWRYYPRTPGDTSVTGWQVMALKSGQMAYLNINPTVFENAKRFLESVSSSKDESLAGRGGIFGYTDKTKSTPATIAVGLLCYQYLGVPRTDPAMIEGTAYLMDHLPTPDRPSEIYYWYYATQVMHNQPGPEWDAWNRKMRKRLIETQTKEGCAAGSWDARTDMWGSRGGRVMQTSLSALTLEVYYRYLPLYKLDKEANTAPPPAAAPEKSADDKQADDKPAAEKSAPENKPISND